MSDSAGREHADRPRFWTAGMIAVCSLGVLVVVLFLTWLAANASARGAVEREIGKIRARGEPATLEELAPPPIPDEENAAVLLEMAFAELDANRGREPKGWKKCLEEPFALHADEVEPALDAQARAMELAREAMKRPRCRFDFDYTEGFDMRLPQLAGLRQLARLFAAEALLHAHEGRAAPAAQSVEQVFRLAEAARDAPHLIVKLVSSAILGIGLDVLDAAQRLVQFPQEAQRMLVKRMRSFDVRRELSHAMLGERLFVQDMVRAVQRELPAWGRPLLSSRLRGDEAALLAIMTEVVAASELSPDVFIRRFRSLGAELDQKHFSLAFLQWGLLAPALAQSFNRLVSTQSRISAARLALTCDLHRSACGEYPDALTALVPEFLPSLPPDPFTGRPFIYERRPDGHGFILYSVGENLKDDGGVKDEKSGKDDISWEREPREEETEARPVEAGTGRDSRER